ncbi:Obg-like ATPase 1 [Wickerhamomyces ciferrii]|uniref:Obg-like ATPase 1 n=1 Tax=Wickerhamomyces ciferrii (strain ATCC 14091 / BCRC 22168 / CBS 111 / JCM 3599 / NBRC 0793 / NRRL Y-1031 F-60-10) TaxID=1206466 RepID=K0K9D8_WICCF|nr:Obg-like ATPase 1 [Wickerhamomyces ciferrii]CCH41525.1 Obg-like ATPase 1 [Wickerhamomyces ciferrii]
MFWIPRRSFNSSAISLAKKVSKGKSSNSSGEPKNALLGRTSSKLSAGIVGLANVGKSTFFQAITKSSLGNPNNYPFATVKPEEALYRVPSDRLLKLSQIYKSSKITPSYLKIVDIAGLVRNASKGEGLGNQFLSDIRNVDGIFHVVRGFDDDTITHIEITVDPIRDLEIVNDELLLKDLETVETTIERNKKDMNKPNMRAELTKENEILEKINDLLFEHGKLSNIFKWTEDEVNVINKHKFLTAKPTVYLLNVSKPDYESQTNKYLKSVQDWMKEHSPNDKLIMFSADHEHEFVNSETASPIINDMVISMKDSLNLISFYTVGKVEAKEWSLKRHSTAPEAAGLIHTDLQKNFINAQVLKSTKVFEKSEELKDVEDVEKAMKYDRNGKDYEVQDGDIIIIKAVGGKTK